MPGFSFLSRSDREQIDQTTEMSGETKRDVEQMVPGGFADFPAKLTHYDAGSGYYSWTRRAWDSNRARYDHPATAQVGTPTSNPARFPNGDVVDVSTPVDVWLRPVGIRTTVGMVHEVIGAPSASSGGGFGFQSAVGVQSISIPQSTQTAIATYPLPTTGYYLLIPNITLTITSAGFTWLSWVGVSLVGFTLGSGVYFGADGLLQRMAGGTDQVVTGYAWDVPIGPSFTVRVDTAPAEITIYVNMTGGTCVFNVSSPYGSSIYGNFLTGIKLQDL